MASLPTGTVTFFFTDIEGSTRIAQKHMDRWEILRDRHLTILEQQIESNAGYLFETIGDATFSAFHTAGDAVRAAVQSQIHLQSEHWNGASLKVRMGIHTGEATIQENGRYRGFLSMSRAQRLMSVAHGGQVLISLATREVIQEEVFEGVTLRDMGQRRLKDLILPEHIFQLVIEQLPSEFPPLKTLDTYRHNLPAQLTRFIGREKEISKISTLLRSQRLITLTGAGGIGKTRLSLQVATNMLGSFPDGVWLVELANLSDPDLVASTTLMALEVNEQKGKPPLETLKEYLHHKNILIVLDNCEHLIDSAARTAHALLSAAPQLKILATSREALDVKGELTWQVPSLTLPDPRNLPEVDQLIHYEATRLFIDRASLVNTEFIVNGDAVSALAQICLRLDGIPLAIELAAARARMMSLEQIASGIDDRFRLLTGGSRTDLPRQQTLRALIDWSYNLLSEQERLLFCRLGIFAGGWTLDLATQVCSDEKFPSQEIMDILHSLVEKSLVVAQHEGTNVRYRVLETVRQYACEKLFESEQGDVLRNQHLRAFLGLAEQAEPEIRGRNQVIWLNRLETEIDNVRAALEWAEESDIQTCLRISSALWRFWDIRGYADEALTWLAKTLAQTQLQRDVIRSRALARASQVASNNGFALQAESYANEAYILGSELNDKPSLARALLILSTLELNRYHEERGLAFLEQSLSLAREIGDHGIVASILYNFGVRARNHSLTSAVTFMEQGLQEARVSEDKRLISHGLKEVGLYSLVQGEVDYARSLVEEALPMVQAMEDGANTLACYWLFTDIALFTDNYAGALEFALEAERFARLHSDKKNIAVSLLYLSLTSWAKGDFFDLYENAQAALSLARGGPDLFLIIELQSFLGEAFRLLGDLEQARSIHRESVTILQSEKILAGFCVCLDGVAALALAQGQMERGVRLMGAREKLRERVFALDNHPFLMRQREHRMKLAHAKMGETLFHRARKTGQSMSLEEILVEMSESLK